MRTSQSSRRRDMAEAAVMAGLLMAYSNGLTVWSQRRSRYPEALFRRLNPILIVLMLRYASRRQGGLDAVGLRREGLLVSSIGGIGLGAALCVPPLLFFNKPILLDTPLEYGPVARLTRREMLEDVLFRVPIGIAVLEELAFRGLLQASLRRVASPGAAIAGSAAAFAGWHIVVTYTSAAQSNLATAARLPRVVRPYVQPLAVAGGMLTTGVAGVLFGLLRERTRNLIGPVLAHWLVDGVMIAALWRGSRRLPMDSDQ